MPLEPRRTAIHPILRIAGSALILLQLAVRTAGAHPTHPGKWTGSMNLNGTAVNLVLLPGWSTTYHSRVLWWDHDDDAPVAGNILGWNPPDDASTNLGTFPASSFTSLTLDDPPLLHGSPSNLFCAGQTMLADGRLFVAGGTDLGEAGNVSALYFDPASDVNGQWTRANDMGFRRWYPDNVLLPDSRVVTASGSMYTHFFTAGGFAAAAPDTQTRMLQRVGLARPSTIESSVVPRKNTVAQEPFDRVSDAAGLLVSQNRMLVYSGLDAGQALTSAGYLVSRERNPFGADYDIRWSDLVQQAAPGFSLPSPRTGTALVTVKDAGDLLLIGGKVGTGPSARIWRGALSNNTVIWRELSNLSSTPLPALHGHSAVYDPSTKRVFIFGGSETSADTPTNANVYSLILSDTTTNTWMWVNPVTSAGPNPPDARSYATLTYIPYARTGVPGALDSSRTRAMLFGGRTASGGYSDNLHAMWIYSATEVRWEAVPLDAAARPSARAKHAAALDGATLWLVMCGGQNASAAALSDVWTYDITCGNTQNCAVTGSPHWDQHPSLPLAVRGHAAAAVGVEPAFARLPEVFAPGAGSTGAWTTLAGAPHWQEWFPFGFVAPRRSTDPAGSDSIRVFYAGPETGSPTFHLSRNTPNWTNMTTGTANFLAGAAVMYRPGKVMKSGTRDTGGSNKSDVFGRTAVIDLKASAPAWAEAAAADQMISRRNHNLVILPTGEVIVIGGATHGTNNVSADTNCVRMPQIWNPDTLTAGHWYGQETGMRFDSSTVRRHYHSTAVLLPDGRVLCAGGAFDKTQQDLADLYSPYYLFNTDGSPAVRPVIQSSPTSVAYGERFPVCMSTSGPAIAKVSLVRSGATTHGFDQNQRFLSLAIEAAPPGAGSPRYIVTAPADSLDAPPGDYMLFVLTTSGTPSVAQWIRLFRSNNQSGHPTMVNNLAKICSQGASVQLQWTPPYGDSATSTTCPGPAARYELRYRQGLMPGWSEFGSASSVSGLPLPNDPAPGQPQSFEVTGLTPNTQYTFRMVSKSFASSAGNWSALGNALTFTSYDEQCGGSGGGGGGGGHEDPLTAENALTIGLGGTTASSSSEYLENTLFVNVPPATAATDVLRLPNGPRWTANGARVRLSRSGAGGTRFTGVRLRGVAIGQGQSAFAPGEDLAVGTLVAPVRVSHVDGRELMAALAANEPFEGHPGDTLLVGFADHTPGRLALTTSGVQQVAPPLQTGIELQCESAEGWYTVAHLDPRALQASALLGVPSAGRVRLVFRGDHKLHGIARFEPGAAAAKVVFEPAAMTHSRLGDLGAGPVAAGVLLVGGEHAFVDFAVPSEQTTGIDWFLEVQGEHVSPGEASLAANQEGQAEALPTRFVLHQNHPNPFEEETVIAFELPVRTRVRLEVFDLAGRRVATLANNDFVPGRHTTTWSRGGSNGRVPAGIYTCRMIADGLEFKRQMVIF